MRSHTAIFTDYGNRKNVWKSDTSPQVKKIFAELLIIMYSMY